MIQTKTLKVSKIIADDMNRICQELDSSVKGSGTEFDEEVVFDNGYRMDIQVCGSKIDACYSQGVLYDSNGSEIDCTEPRDSFTGEYRIDDNEVQYIVTVESE